MGAVRFSLLVLLVFPICRADVPKNCAHYLTPVEEKTIALSDFVLKRSTLMGPEGRLRLTMSHPAIVVTKFSKPIFVLLSADFVAQTSLQTVIETYLKIQNLDPKNPMPEKITRFLLAYKDTGGKVSDLYWQVSFSDLILPKGFQTAQDLRSTREPVVLTKLKTVGDAAEMILLPIYSRFEAQKTDPRGLIALAPAEGVEDNGVPSSSLFSHLEEKLFDELDLLDRRIREGGVGTKAVWEALVLLEKHLRDPKNLDLARQLLDTEDFRRSTVVWWAETTKDPLLPEENLAIFQEILERLFPGAKFKSSAIEWRNQKRDENRFQKNALLVSLIKEEWAKLNPEEDLPPIILHPKISEDVNGLAAPEEIAQQLFVASLVRILSGKTLVNRHYHIKGSVGKTIQKARGNSTNGEYRIFFDVDSEGVYRLLHVTRRNDMGRMKVAPVLAQRLSDFQKMEKK